MQAITDLQTIRDNAARLVESLQIQIAALQGKIDAVGSTLQEIEQERLQGIAEQERLRAALQAAKHDLERAKLSLPITQGTGAHEQAQATVDALEARFSTLQAQYAQAAKQQGKQAQALQAQHEQALHEQESLQAALHELQEQLQHFQHEHEQAHTALGQATHEQVEQEIAASCAALAEKQRDALLFEARVSRVKREAASRLAAWPSLAMLVQEKYCEPVEPLQDSTTRVFEAYLQLLKTLEYCGQDMARAIDNRPFLQSLTIDVHLLQAVTMSYDEAAQRHVSRLQLLEQKRSTITSLLERYRKNVRLYNLRH